MLVRLQMRPFSSFHLEVLEAYSFYPLQPDTISPSESPSATREDDLLLSKLLLLMLMLLTMEVEQEVTFDSSDPLDRSDPLRRCSDLAISAKIEFATIRVDPIIVFMFRFLKSS